jgi:uncharacterized phage protein (TIGR02220 family)
MARRNQPYIPLYADDFQTDEKLIMCSAESTGVFIRIMCLMHKSEPYGKILLKQKFKQTPKQVSNFASQLAIYFPYDRSLIERSLDELVDEDVLQIDGDFLVQKRMVRDAEISEIRKGVGEIGGKKSAEKRTETKDSFASDFAQAKSQANTGIGIGNTITSENTDSKGIGGMGEKGLAIVNNEMSVVKSDDYSQFIAMFNSITGRQYRGDTKSKAAFNARKKQGWTLEQFDKAIRSVMTDRYHIESNFKYLTPEFITREDKLDKFHAQSDAPMADPNRKLLKGTTVQQHNEGLERFKAIMEAKQNGTGQPS